MIETLSLLNYAKRIPLTDSPGDGVVRLKEKKVLRTFLCPSIAMNSCSRTTDSIKKTVLVVSLRRIQG